MNIPKNCGVLGKILVEIGLEEDEKKRWKDSIKMDFREIVCENR
jgi:hypothetical protein